MWIKKKMLELFIEERVKERVDRELNKVGKKNAGLEGVEEENKKLQEENQKLESENRGLKSRIRGMHPATGVDRELLEENTSLKNINRRQYEELSKVRSFLEQAEAIKKNLNKIPRERKVIVVKKKEEEKIKNE